MFVLKASESKGSEAQVWSGGARQMKECMEWEAWKDSEPMTERLGGNPERQPAATICQCGAYKQLPWAWAGRRLAGEDGADGDKDECKDREAITHHKDDEPGGKVKDSCRNGIRE